MRIPLVDLKRQYQTIKVPVEPRILEFMAGTDYIMGRDVALLESELADYIGVKHSIAVANGTDALIISLRSLGITGGDEVITTPFTFFSTAEAIAAVGAVPVLPMSLERLLTLTLKASVKR